MGNQQKKSKSKSHNKTNLSENYNYLLCPKCWKKVPFLNTFIDGDNIKVKLFCTCLENNHYFILDLVEYLSLINNRKINNQCSIHPESNATYFCMNCENWLCRNCFSNHTKATCKSEYNKNNDQKINCEKHNPNKKVYFCKQCRDLFCKICFLKHNIRNKVPHKGVNIEHYNTKVKMKSKTNKYNEYQQEVIELDNNFKTDILLDINSMQNNNNNNINNDDNKNKINDGDLMKFKDIIQNKYLVHKEINEQLKYLIEIILKNYEYLIDESIINKNFICDIIINTGIKVKYPKLNKATVLLDQINNFINYLNTKFINKNITNKLTFVKTIDKINSRIEMMLSLPNNKFVSINKDCAIQIWDSETNKNIYTLHEHINNITSIILLKNKKYFATASDDCTIKIWDYSKGACIKTIVTEGKPFLIYEVFEKENQIGCVPNRNSLTIYEYNESNQKIIFNIPLEKSLPWIEGLYQTPDDGRIIISNSGFFEVYSPEIKLIKKVFISNDTPKNFLQLKNKDIVVSFLSKEVFIYDNDLNYKSRLVGHKKTITSILEFNEDKFLTCSLDSDIILWRNKDYEMISYFINNDMGISSMILINNRLITSSYDKNSSLNEWEIEMYE